MWMTLWGGLRSNPTDRRACWSAVALFLALPQVARGDKQVRRHADMVMGVVLIFLGLKLAVFG